MVTLTGTSLTFKDTLYDDPSLGLSYVNDNATAEINGITYVYSAGRFDDAIQVSTLSNNGILTPVTTIPDTGGTSLNGANRLETFEVGGAQFLAVVGLEDDGVTIYSLTDSAPYLTYSDSAFDTDNPDTNLEQAFDLSILTLSGGTFLYVTGGTSNGVSVFSIDGTGALSNVQNLDDGGTLEFWTIRGVSEFTLDGAHYLLITSWYDDGISILSVDDTTGEVAEVVSFDGAATGILNALYFAAALEIDGTAYLYIPEYGDDAITTMAFDGTSVTLEDRLVSPTALNGAKETEVLELGDRKILVVASAISAELSLFEIDTAPLSQNKGGLTPLQTITDATGGGAPTGASSSDMVTVGGTRFLLVAADTSSAVNVYEIGGGDDLLTGSNAADDLSGMGGDDTLEGLGGDDSAAGGDGDDLLDGGSGNDSLSAGAGDDVLLGGGGSDTLLGEAGDDDIFGGSGDDSLEGGDGTDWIEAGSGDDFMRGNDGSDWIIGESGADTISAGAGEDTVRGGDDEDRIFGGEDGDALAGNAGDDYLRGGSGDDEVYGGTGNDDMDGEADDDTLDGGLGDDLMRGGDGDDLLLGNRGADTLVGNAGNDVIRGGADDDRIIGSTGSDTLSGESGSDTFVFSNQNQSPHGDDRDVIEDFTAGIDLIDLTDFGGLDFVTSYTGAGNEVRYNSAIGRLYIDVDGDQASDFSVDLIGAPVVDESDLLL